MIDAIRSFFRAEGFMPHGMCYLWQPELLWLHVVSDSVVALSYFAIPPMLVYLVWRARGIMANGDGDVSGFSGIPHERMFVAFGIFIVACGVTHVVAVVTVWLPLYWVSGTTKAITAGASLITAIALPPMIPRTLDLIRSARDANENRLDLEATHLELQATHAQMREADRMRTQFFANVSHELRTPLTLILGPVDQLLEEADGARTDEVRRLGVIKRNALQLLAHVDGLLDAALIEAGGRGPRYSEVDAAELVRGVASHFEVLAEECSIDFRIAGPDRLSTVLDRSKTERIVMNLLSNAFKFTEPGGRVGVRFGIDALGERPCLSLLVEDDGPGIPPPLREAVFERLHRGVQEAQRTVVGTGLGLAICREFAETQGGAIRVGDSDLGGAALVVQLPLAPADEYELADTRTEVDVTPVVETLRARKAEASRERGERTAVEAGDAPGAHHAPNPAGARGVALIVDDHADLRRYVCEVLSPEWDCLQAASVTEGLASARTIRPDVIITDLMMPDAPGDELVRVLRESGDFQHVPILVLSARADPSLPAAMIDGGAQDFLTKPVRADELRARVRNLVKLSHARRLISAEVDSDEQDIVRLSEQLAEKKRALEAALAERTHLLEEVQRAAEVVRTQVQELERSNRDLEQFAYVASHDLQEPLRMVSSFTELLQSEYAADLDETAHEYIGYAVDGASRMRDLIDDLLEFSRVGRTDTALETLNLGAIVDEVARRALEDGPSDGRVTRGELPPIVGNPASMRRLLWNLISNGLKFGGDDPHVHVSARSVDDGWELRIADRGIGIDAAHHDEIFEVFLRLHTRDKYPGSGVGLAICRRIVENAGGSIRVESTPGEGSTFFVQLPERHPDD